MNLWYKKTLIFVTAAVAYLVGQYFRGVWLLNSGFPNVCGHATQNGVAFCNSQYIDTLGWPLIMLGEMLALVGVVLLFANVRGFRSWLRFSYFYVPLAAILTITLFPFEIVPIGPPAPIWGAVRFFGVLYALITAGIVIYTRVRPPKLAALP